MANLTVSQLNSVELLGGGVRMPKVRKTLDDYFKESKLEVGQHINGDEAMALGEGNTINGFRFERILFLQMFFLIPSWSLGAAFRAANLSTAFRVRKVGISDVSSFDITVRMTTLPAAPSSSVGGLGGFFGNLLGKKKQSEASTGSM